MSDRTAKLARNRGAEVALQAQLDEVARVLGAERMEAADGYHYEAVKALVADAIEARALLCGYLELAPRQPDALVERTRAFLAKHGRTP